MYLAIALIAVHGAALAVLMLPAWQLWAKILPAFLLLANLLHQLRCHAWLSAPASSVALLLEQDGRAVLTARNGEQVIGKLMRDSLVTPLLTVLNVLPQGGHRSRSIIVLPDNLDAESFRQLRVSLKCGISPG